MVPPELQTTHMVLPDILDPVPIPYHPKGLPGVVRVYVKVFELESSKVWMHKYELHVLLPVVEDELVLAAEPRPARAKKPPRMERGRIVCTRGSDFNTVQFCDPNLPTRDYIFATRNDTATMVPPPHLLIHGGQGTHSGIAETYENCAAPDPTSSRSFWMTLISGSLPFPANATPPVSVEP